MDDKTIKATETILAQGDRVELIPVKDGVKVIRVRREEIRQVKPEENISNHDCKVDCNLFEKCKAAYLKGSVIKCLHFGNKKNFSGLKK